MGECPKSSGEIHDTSQYTVEGDEGVGHRQVVQTRGLNKGHPQLKQIFTSAAQSAISQYVEVRDDYRARREIKPTSPS